MNWSRAKTILIIALIITNLFLLSNYKHNETKEAEQVAASSAAAVEYVKNHGIDISCEVPQSVNKIKVISVSFIEGDTGGGVYRTMLEEMPLEIIGFGDGSYISSVVETGNKIETLPAYNALLKCVGSIEGEIDKIELIYLVDRAEYIGQGGEDTALPYWKLSSGDNSYYYSAFSE